MSSLTPEFIGWEKPFLPEVAAWLVSRYTHGDMLDLSNVVVALPGARAGRRLLELLTLEDAILVPPRFVTAGSLPELLSTDEANAADRQLMLMAWIRALQSVSTSGLTTIFASAPDADDFSGWADLARQVSSLHETLAADHVRFDDLIRAKSAGEYDESERWKLLARIRTGYLRALSETGSCDPNERRFAALDKELCRSNGDIVVAGMPDLNTLTCQMLKQASEHGIVSILVQAPECERSFFDEFGRPIPAEWKARRIFIQPGFLVVADQPRDQSLEVLRLLQPEKDLCPDEITVGVCDETLVPGIERSLLLAGIPCRSAAGRSVASTRPCIFLAALAELVRTSKFRALGSLLRHPDFAASLNRSLGLNARDGAAWLRELDDYAVQHLPAWAPYNRDAWIGRPRGDAVTRVGDAVRAEVVTLAGKRTLAAWTAEIVRVLELVFGVVADEDEIAGVFKEIGRELESMAALPTSGPLAFEIEFPDASEWLLNQMADIGIPPDGGESAIEILGWLELALDDAPRLIVAGFNEQNIPGGAASDPFLPDSTRAALGVQDSSRRYARDAMLLEAILSSDRRVSIIAGRRNADGDPLIPSRLLLACGDEELLDRLKLCLAERPSPSVPWRLLKPGRDDAIIIPPPRKLDAPLPYIRVTDFGKFMECPYTFYLNRVLHLESVDDHADELDPLRFGMAFHEVLKRFAEAYREDPIPEPAKIRAHLDSLLNAHFREEYGRKLTTPLRLQKAMMRERLAVFSDWQAGETLAGWTIEALEKKHDLILRVAGQDATIRGTIDRVDKLVKDGVTTYRILDYKTGASEVTPDDVHRRGRAPNKRWFALQLPLYRLIWLDLLEKSPIVGEESGTDARIELGLFNLCQSLEKIGFYPANWNDVELESAKKLAEEIILEIREERFWPPKVRPAFPPEVDFVAALRMDHHIDRERIIEKVGRQFGLLPSLQK